MIIQKFLSKGTEELRRAGIASARLDVLILLEDVLHRDRAYLLAHVDTSLTPAQYATLNNYITRRRKHVPLAYIRGKSQFYGREFAVNKHVLVPRPETEALIEMLLKNALPAHPKLADIGAGSGCIGITTALELPEAIVFLYDVDPQALEVAKQNARRHKAKVRVMQQDLLTDCPEHFDVIMANLPYVPQGYPVNLAATHEPEAALYSGIDGLDHYRKLWQQIATLKEHQPAQVILEALPEQHAMLIGLAQTAGYSLTTVQGLGLTFVRQKRT